MSLLDNGGNKKNKSQYYFKVKKNFCAFLKGGNSQFLTQNKQTILYFSNLQIGFQNSKLQQNFFFNSIFCYILDNYILIRI